MEIYGAALNAMKLSRMVYFIVMSKISMEFHASVTKSLLCDLGFFAQTSIQKKVMRTLVRCLPVLAAGRKYAGT